MSTERMSENTKDTTNEFMNAMVNAYVILIGVVLPLYMKNGFQMIGDAKYGFFLKVACIFCVISVVGVLWSACAFVKGKWRQDNGKLLGAVSGRQYGRYGKERKEIENRQWSVLDFFMISYALHVVVSFCFSEYKETALFGYADWHMGLITQLLLVWSYFFVSRFYSEEKLSWILMSLAAGGIFFIGVLNRYNYDPLGVFEEIGRWEWNRVNLLSTIGNINWYSGYMCLTLPFVLYAFWNGKGLLRAAGGIGSLIGTFSLHMQGSMSGYAGLGGILVVLCFFSLRDANKWQRFLQLAFMVTVVPVIIMGTLEAMPRGVYLPEAAILEWKGWIGCSLLISLLLIINGVINRHRRMALWENGSLQRIFGLSLVILLLIFAVMVILCQVSDTVWQLLGGRELLRIDNAWGNGRGFLWKTALHCFVQGGWKQRLIGAGPDCFAHIAYEIANFNEVYITGQWQGAVFANAHNEWLNMLVNGGIWGAVSYLGIYMCAIRRFSARTDREPLMVMGIMMVVGYGIHNIFSFQQIITVPIVFAVMGMLEKCCRNNDKNNDTSNNKMMI